MSFLGGAECSTASNPLTQFAKHTQDDRSLQRDRLLDVPDKGTQSIRSVGRIDSIGTQDNIINDFGRQNSQLVLEDFSVSHNSQYEPRMKIGPQSPEFTGWAKEFTSGVDDSNKLSVDYHVSQSMPINLSGYSQFQQINGKNPAGTLATYMAQRLKEHNHQMNMDLAMNIGMGDTTMGYMSSQIRQPYRFQQYEGKGKAKMIELDDENWEEQFKQIDLLSEKQDLEELNAVETELDQVDKSILEPERNDFGDFESIWKGIKAQTSTDIDLSIEDQMANPSSSLDHWDDVPGMNLPFQSPHVGEYLFEEENLFKEVSNPFEEGLRIMSDGGNLSLAALAFEAAVQKEPDHVDAWVMLGSAQAQNEKETPAIRALEKALKLDPANLNALMSLAVSYTNEGYDSMTYHTLERWLSFKYPSIINPNSPTLSISQIGFTDRAALHERVIELFIQAAQLSPDGEHMDPDVQVGLGVLFYGAEEYDKAVDCFSAALASTESGLSNKRDQLHLLWNRLGATLANSGRSEEAIAAYEKALTIRPNFVRARYNLGVSCINIGCYEEAVSHLLSALAMHKVVENEGRQKARDIFNGSTSGDTSETLNDSQLDSMISQNQSNNLYNTLRRVFSQMGRRDLADRVVIDMDIESFRSDFDF
ncbi:Peroxisomal targeting signal receptor [Erysiphe neolycopersici]|uniref:Peroxisomal targeting signal receptor n=1 Tax=Erysiphe neolycopersici TaxID=212602 RepID=A0A420HBJ6_9PEZI|nr:Peroxisomal targeting signal receptor [Erysiphe neolycopersici]